MASGRRWSEDEIRQVLVLYLRTPFGRLHSSNQDIQALAARLGRTPGAVALKACNLAALDNSLPRKGMGNASKLDRKVWEEFLAQPASLLPIYERSVATIEPAHQPSGLADTDARRISPPADTTGEERPAQVMRRLGQDFFRRMILTSYEQRCALTGLDDPRLLIASHIVGWKEDASIRLHPANGICLNALHDKAFDRRLITFDENYRLVVAEDIPPQTRKKLQDMSEGQLRMPARFLPSQDFLEHHRKCFFDRQTGIHSSF